MRGVLSIFILFSFHSFGQDYQMEKIIAEQQEDGSINYSTSFSFKGDR